MVGFTVRGTGMADRLDFEIDVGLEIGLITEDAGYGIDRGISPDRRGGGDDGHRTPTWICRWASRWSSYRTRFPASEIRFDVAHDVLEDETDDVDWGNLNF
jgi:hypothetical protein